MARRRSPRRRRGRRGGFTLIELVLVITTIALLSAIAVPRWSNAAARYEADFAARRVAADLTAARARANYGSASVTVTFNVQAASYQVTGMTDPDHPTASAYIVLLAAPPYRATITSASFGGTNVAGLNVGGTPTVSFDGYGTPSQGGTVVVTVGSRSHTVTLDGATGATTIQ